MHHAEAAYCHPASSLACSINFSGRCAVSVNVVRIALQAAPALIGAFAGAPVLARELETGTFRFAWTQGIGRRRWTIAKLVLLAAVVAAAAGALTVLVAWYNQPWAAAGYVTPFSPRVFDLLGVAFAAWTLAAFAIGVLAGMLIRRAVPAIAATLAAYAGLAFATGLYLRERYITPLVTSSPNPPGSASVISGWYTKGGTFAFGDHGTAIVNTVRQFSVSAINCTATIDGTGGAAHNGKVKATFTNGTNTLKVSAKGGNLHIYNASSGCNGAVSNNDPVNFTGGYKFTPKTTITSR
jgi:ABC-2 family transporter